MQDLKDIQIEIKKELGGVSLNHLLFYLKEKTTKTTVFDWFNVAIYSNNFYISFNYGQIKFRLNFILLNDQNQALNIFGQSEGFQRNFYDAIQIIKIINNK
jgi:hypothetical protein